MIIASMRRDTSMLNVVTIDLKSFEVVRVGRWVHITERGWKLVKSLHLELATTWWFTKALEDCLKVGRREFYTAHQKGDRGFIAQRCSNSKGLSWHWWNTNRGGQRNCILIPEGIDGRGWTKPVEVLREAGREGRIARLTPPTTMAVMSASYPSKSSYLEALQKPSARGLVASPVTRRVVAVSA